MQFVPLAGAGTAAGIITRAGFSRCGSTLLMYRGRKQDYYGEQISALASMESYG